MHTVQLHGSHCSSSGSWQTSRQLTVPHKLLAVRLDVGKVLLGLRGGGGTQTLCRGGGAVGVSADGAQDVVMRRAAC